MMKFNWTGDLKDDCALSVKGFSAHCECLADDMIVSDNADKNEAPFHIECWFVGVYRDYAPPAKDEDVLFHSGEHGGMITSGEMARAIAEAVLKGHMERPTIALESS